MPPRRTTPLATASNGGQPTLGGILTKVLTKVGHPMTALEVIDEAVKMGLWSADVNRGQKRANLASLVSRELKVNGTRWMRVGRGQFALGTQVEAKVEGTLL